MVTVRCLVRNTSESLLDMASGVLRESMRRYQGWHKRMGKGYKEGSAVRKKTGSAMKFSRIPWEWS